jgi:hypothetical protein
MERYLSFDAIDATFHAWWVILGLREATIPLALQQTRSQIGPSVPPDYVPPPQRPSSCCMVHRGEFADEYLTLNGLSMDDLLRRLTEADRDHLIALRAHVAEASGVFNGRLMTAMDAVWYRNFDPVLRSIGEQLVRFELDAFLQLEAEQRTAVGTYMLTGGGPPPPAAPAAPAAPVAAPAGSPFPDSVLRPLDTPEKTDFKRRVYNAHVAAARRAGRTFHANLPDDQLALVENRQRMRSDAVAACRQLLASARADLATAQGAGEALAVAATSIGAGSGYRSATDELTIWESLFPQYYAATSAARAAADGGEHGAAAVSIMVAYYSGRKAAPGFGNHTEGIAMDFITNQGGVALGASVAQNPLWRASWLHGWIVAHAPALHWTPLSTEAWHWEFHP